MFITTQSRWRALQARCPSSHSAFVYAVLTTRIYCRPTCPARLARRANVEFYDTATAAAAAGFRACKRCKPEQQTDREEDVQRDAADRGREIIERAKGSVTVKEVAKEVGLSSRYFHGIFKKVVGVTPGFYMERLRRMQRVKEISGGQEQQQTLPSLEMELIVINGDQGSGVLQDYFSAAPLNDPTLPGLTPDNWAVISSGDESQFDIYSFLEESTPLFQGPEFTAADDNVANTSAALIPQSADIGFPSAELGFCNTLEPSWHEAGTEYSSLTTEWPFWREDPFFDPYQALSGFGPNQILAG